VAAEAGAGGEVDDGGCTAEAKECPGGGRKRVEKGRQKKVGKQGHTTKKKKWKRGSTSAPTCPMRAVHGLVRHAQRPHGRSQPARVAQVRVARKEGEGEVILFLHAIGIIVFVFLTGGGSVKKRLKVGGVVAAAAGGGGREDTGSSSNSGSNMPGGDFSVDDALVDEFFGGSRGGVSTCIGGQQVRQHLALLCPEVPKQDNGFDCGVFALQYAEEVVQRSPDIPSEDLRRNMVSGFNRNMFGIEDMHVSRFMYAPPPSLLFFALLTSWLVA
jgi:hypothetical protein